MEVSSIAGAVKLLVPVLPFLKKVLIFETFFSLSSEKKAEAVAYLKTCATENDALDAYQQELKLSEYKMTQDYALSDYAIRFYLLDRKKHSSFCKSVFNGKSLYNYANSELVIKKNVFWFPFFMLLIGIMAAVGGWFTWSNETLGAWKWFYAGGCAIVAVQYIIYSCWRLLSYWHLMRYAKKFYFFILLTRIRRELARI